MSNFNNAIDIVLQHEGGYSNDPDDPGGSTNFGITQRYLNGLVAQGKYQATDVRYLTVDAATHIYQLYWWIAYSYGSIVDQSLATKIFDEAVNIGPGRLHRFVQQACCDLGQQLTVDGALGQHSFDAINALNPQQLLAKIKERLIEYYQELATEHPVLGKYLNGWINRANS